MKTTVNYKRIKREIIKRDTGFDSRFVTKVSKSEKFYNRQLEKKVNF
jgi:hypothetical protein